MIDAKTASAAHTPSKLKLPLIDIIPPSPNPQSDFEFMATHGFLIKRGLIEEALIDELRNWTVSHFAQPDLPAYDRIQDAYKQSEPVRRLAIHPAVLSLLEDLYGRRAIPFQTLNFPRGTQQETHSDAFHFSSWPQRWMCGVWVALEDVSELNGPLHYYPGSHRLPILDTHDTSASGNQYAHYQEAIQELIAIAGLQKQRFLPRKGDCLIWAANLLHGGDPIRDPQSSRLSQVSHYYFEGCDFFTPRLSDLAAGSIHFRDQIVDIATGTRVPPNHPDSASKRLSVASAALARQAARVKRRLRNVVRRQSE